MANENLEDIQIRTGKYPNKKPYVIATDGEGFFLRFHYHNYQMRLLHVATSNGCTLEQIEHVSNILEKMGYLVENPIISKHKLQILNSDMPSLADILGHFM